MPLTHLHKDGRLNRLLSSSLTPRRFHQSALARRSKTMTMTTVTSVSVEIGQHSGMFSLD